MARHDRQRKASKITHILPNRPDLTKIKKNYGLTDVGEDDDIGDCSDSGGTSSPPPNPPTEHLFPMVEVANPHYGIAGADEQNPDTNRTVLVYRPWTTTEMKAAVAGLPPVEEDVNETIQALDELRLAFRLNGTEMLKVYRLFLTQMEQSERQFHRKSCRQYTLRTKLRRVTCSL